VAEMVQEDLRRARIEASRKADSERVLGQRA